MKNDNGSAPSRPAQPAMPEKTVLIGMMGAGKSTVGRLAAAASGRPFVDVDAVIEEEAGIAIAEIFSRDGEAAFRTRELDAIQRLVAAPGPVVIAAGGGAFCQEGVRRCLAGRTTTVFLRVDEAELVRRLGRADPASRPVLGGDGWEERVADIVRARYPIYETADLVLPIGDEPPQATCRRLLDLLSASLPESNRC